MQWHPSNPRFQGSLMEVQVVGEGAVLQTMVQVAGEVAGVQTSAWEAALVPVQVVGEVLEGEVDQRLEPTQTLQVGVAVEREGLQPSSVEKRQQPSTRPTGFLQT